MKAELDNICVALNTELQIQMQCICMNVVIGSGISVSHGWILCLVVEFLCLIWDQKCIRPFLFTTVQMGIFSLDFFAEGDTSTHWIAVAVAEPDGEPPVVEDAGSFGGEEQADDEQRDGVAAPGADVARVRAGTDCPQLPLLILHQVCVSYSAENIMG